MAKGTMPVTPPDPKGAYYTPSVDEAGNLTWTPSNESMPAVEGANIKGPQGEQGAQGSQGPTGADGYTPVKGTDYFTDSDKEEMVTAVLARIVDGNEVEY